MPVISLNHAFNIYHFSSHLQMTCADIMHRLCQVEIAKRTAAYTKVVCELRTSVVDKEVMMDVPRPSWEIGNTLLPLPLPSDAFLSEFQQLLHPQITELVI